MTETAARARVLTARLDVRRPRGGAADSWRIAAINRLTYVQGLYGCDSSLDAVRRARVHDPGAGRTVHASQRFSLPGPERRRRHRPRAAGPRRNEVRARAADGKGTAANLQRQRNPDSAVRRRLRPHASRRLRNARRRIGPSRYACRPAAGQTRAGRLCGGSAEIVQHRSPRPQPRNVVHPASERRLPRRGPHQQVRHAHLFPQRRQRRGHHAVRPRAQTRYFALRVAVDARRPRRRRTTKTTCAPTTSSTTTSIRSCIPTVSSSRDDAPDAARPG